MATSPWLESASSNGYPAPILPARRHALMTRRARTRQAVGHLLTPELGSWFSSQCADRSAPDGPAADDALDWLSRGVTVSISCHGPQREPESGRAHTRIRSLHHLHLQPDGMILLADHGPEVDLRGETILAALLGEGSACVLTAQGLQEGTLISGRGPVVFLGSPQQANNKIRAVWTAVQWAAQDGPVDWKQISPFLRYGLTPTLLNRWNNAGWSLQQAAPFVRHFVTPDQAEHWRAARRVTLAAARLAASGATPAHNRAWLEAGFTAATAEPWQRLAPRLAPAQAYALTEAGMSASWYHRICGPGTSWSHSGQGLAPEHLASLLRAGLTLATSRGWFHYAMAIRAKAVTPEQAVTEACEWLRAGKHFNEFGQAVLSAGTGPTPSPT